MNGVIYLIKDNDQLIEMTEQAYVSEDLLQGLIAKYPSLLPGDQIDSAEPRRWLLITREAAVPSEEGGAGQFAIDLLFLDQDAIPTLVEVKRGSDTRIRREVVGQMLDYAANAVLYLPIDKIHYQFEATWKEQGRDPKEVLGEFLGSYEDHEQFWQKAKNNLQDGKVRLLFVADEIPAELRSVVEFLNAQMDKTEVLAVEIKQYVGEDLKTLVPRIIGQTEEAQQKKSGGQRQWDEPSFFKELEKIGGTDEANVAREILRWAMINMPRIKWGKGLISGSFTPFLDHKGIDHSLVTVWTYDGLSIRFDNMKTRQPFNDETRRQELLRHLNGIPGINIPAKFINSYPTIKYSTLKDKAILGQFLGVLDWAVKEIKAS